MNTVLLTIVGPDRRADVAAPSDTPVDELLPTFAQLTGGRPDAFGLVLGAARRAPLDGDLTLADQGLVDGCILHLRPAGEAVREHDTVTIHGGAGDDGLTPLQRTLAALPAYNGTLVRIRPAVQAAVRRRKPGTDYGRFERYRTTWRSYDYEPGLEAAIRAPRMRRTATIAVASPHAGAGTTTMALLLGSLLAHLSRERPVVVDALVDGEPPLRPRAQGGVHILDCGAALDAPAVAAADQLLLVCDAGRATPALVADELARLGPLAPSLVLAVNRLKTGRGQLSAAALERAVPQARGLVGIHHEPRRAARVADGSFAWHERTGTWGVELRELAAVLEPTGSGSGSRRRSGRLADRPDEDLVDVDVRRLLHGEHHRAGDVVGLEGVGDRVVEERRVDHAGLDRRHPHARVVEILARGLRHRRDRVLRRAVERAGQRAAPGDGARQQQVALAVLQRRDRRADRVRAAEDVREHHVAPVLGRLLEKAALCAEAGVREDDVDAAERVQRGLHHRLLPPKSVTSQVTAIARSAPPSSSASASSLSVERAASTSR